MTDEELEHRLTDVENRSKSNTHRLDDLEKLTDAVNGMNTNIKLTIQQLETTNKSLENVTAQNKKQDDRLTALEKAPGAFGNKLWWAVIAAFVSGLVAYELAAILH
jgi:septal ring factor EnvC (AmiA/AmiB activator)